MSSRVEQKAAARAQREQTEERLKRRQERRRSLGRLAIVAIAALVAVATAVALTGPEAKPPPAATTALAGLPQHGLTLGAPDAPATLVEFADLQCPFCGEYSREVLPTVIDRYVRTNRLKLELNVLTFVGADSERAGRMAGAAMAQDKLWDFADAFYARQGTENTGYVTDDFLREVGAAAGLDVEAAMRARDGQDLSSAQARAHALGVQSTPSFFVRVGNGAPRPVKVTELTPAALTAALDAALKR